MRWLLAALFAALIVGCSTKKPVTIAARPQGSVIKIDGVEAGKDRVTRKLEFKNKKDFRTITVSRFGYQDHTQRINRDIKKGSTINVDLKPVSARLNISISPVPALVSIDGRAVAGEPVDGITQELPFTIDARNNFQAHVIRAERAGFEPAERIVTWPVNDPNIAIRLEPQKKDLSITTNPPGAQVFIDGEPLGKSPVNVSKRPFPIDLSSDEVIPQKLRVERPGYEPIETSIKWDEGKREYHIDLTAKSKTVRVVTDPPNAVVQIDGRTLERDRSGAATAMLQFPPVNEKGDLASYVATITKKTAESEWEPHKLTIAWDGGRQDYSVALKEILTRPVPLLSANMQRTDDGWEIAPQITSTLAMKDVLEGRQKDPPLQITRLPRGTQIDTLTVSPDGSRLLFTVLYGKDKNTLRSQMIMVRTDGSGGQDQMSDAKSLEITPSFTPGGDQIVFSSNRAGRRLSVWSMSAIGAPGIVQLTRGETNDLWPTIDSAPKTRLFYQAMVDRRPDPRLYMTQLGTTTLTDLTHVGGSQPRVSPKADSVIFTAVNDNTGKRDIYVMPDRGGEPKNLTNTPDIDEFDPAWNKDGTRVAFVCDAGVDQDRRNNLDIWVLDLARPERPAQITTNGSWDDHPCWDPMGSGIYFRSNRGGEWAIWKVVSR